MTSRIAMPNLSELNQVHVTGIGLINIFTSDLFDFINKSLSKSKGQNWLIDLQVQNIGADQNFRDPSVLLKELVRKGQSPLRLPVSALVPPANWKDFYKRLEVNLLVIKRSNFGRLHLCCYPSFVSAKFKQGSQ